MINQVYQGLVVIQHPPTSYGKVKFARFKQIETFLDCAVFGFLADFGLLIDFCNAAAEGSLTRTCASVVQIREI